LERATNQTYEELQEISRLPQISHRESSTERRRTSVELIVELDQVVLGWNPKVATDNYSSGCIVDSGI
jgi:hypothetical protein